MMCFQVKSNDDLLAAMAGGAPASNNAVNKSKRAASTGTNVSNLDSKPKTTAGNKTHLNTLYTILPVNGNTFVYM